MDGFPHLSLASDTKRTLKAAIPCTGVGVHSGQRVSVVLRPAEPRTGIVLRRTDLGVDIPARYDHVVETRLSTTLGLPDRPETWVGTVEHLLAAMAGCRVTDCIVEIDGPEVPVLDGSAAPWVFLMDCAGFLEQGQADVIEVLRPVRVSDGPAFAELRPKAGHGLTLAMSIAFEAAAIGRQALTLDLSEPVFRRDLAAARTFGLAHEVAALRSAGLARGGTLRNAVVVDGARVLSPGGLRMPDEFVRHKALDAVGDLSLAGAPLVGRFIGHRSGHALNNQLLRALFASPANWRLVEAVSDAWVAPVAETAAAA